MEAHTFPNDHDLLVAINTKLDLWIPEFKQGMSELRKELHEEATSLKERVTLLERAADRQSGFISGGKALWAFITALPSGVIGVVLGKHLDL